MSPSQAAKILGCSTSCVRSWIRDGKLKAKEVPDDRKGYRYEITEKEVARFAALPKPKNGWKRGRKRGPKNSLDISEKI